MQLSDLTPDQIAVLEEVQLQFRRNWYSQTTDPQTKSLEVYRDFAKGNQWRSSTTGSSYWTGKTGKNDSLLEVEKVFVSDDQISPSLERFAAGLLGQEPEFTASNPDDKAAKLQLEQANTFMAELEKKTFLHAKIRDAVKRRMPVGQVGLRVFIPRRFAAQALEGNVDLKRALGMIQVQVVDGLACGYVLDQDQVIIGAWYRYYEWSAANIQQNFVELHTQEFIMQCFDQGQDLEIINIYENPLKDLNLDHEYLLFISKRSSGSILSDAIIQQQKRLNVDTTYMGRNSDAGAFRQVIVTNSSAPTKIIGGQEIVIPYSQGPAVVNIIQGLPIRDRETKTITGYTDPKVITIEPIDPQHILTAIKHYQISILSAFYQEWVHPSITTGSRALSGTSRQEQRKPFERWIIHESLDVIEMYEFAYRTMLALLSRLTGDATLLELRIKPKLHLDITKGSLDLFKQLLEAYKLGAVSLEAVVDANPGITDSDAELVRLLVARGNTDIAALLLASVGAPTTALLETLKNAGYAISDEDLAAAGDVQTLAYQMPVVGQ